jgi:ribose transport system substrate-binding protein
MGPSTGVCSPVIHICLARDPAGSVQHKFLCARRSLVLVDHSNCLDSEDKTMLTVRPKMFVLVGALALLVLVLAACAPAAAPAAPAPAATEAVATEAAATEAPTEAAATEAAATEAAATEAAAAPAEAVKVALVYGVKGDGFYVTMEAGARAKAEELGVEFSADGPAQFDATLQRPILDAVIAQNPSTICIAATDKQAMIEPVKAAFDRGINIVSVDTFMGDTAGDYTTGAVTFPLSYVGSDNVEGGKTACQAVIDQMGGKGTMYIQNVKPGISTTDQREEGCKQAIEETNGAVELVGVDYNDDSAAKAAEQTSAVLQRVPDLGGVFGANLFSAEGASQAVKNAGLSGTVKVAAFDAPEAAIADLRDSVVDIVIAQHPYEMGQKCIEYAVAAAGGKTDEIQKRWPTGYTIITRDNVDSPEAQQAIYKSQP